MTTDRTLGVRKTVWLEQVLLASTTDGPVYRYHVVKLQNSLTPHIGDKLKPEDLAGMLANPDWTVNVREGQNHHTRRRRT